MPLLINRTYEVITDESAENGEAVETGFDSEDEPVTFRELVDLMREHNQSSCYPSTGHIYEWFTSTDNDPDPVTGEYRNTSIHYSRSNPPRMEKYWRLAVKAAKNIVIWSQP